MTFLVRSRKSVRHGVACHWFCHRGLVYRQVLARACRETKLAWFNDLYSDRLSNSGLLEAHPVQHLLNLNLVHPHSADGQHFVFKTSTRHGFESRVVKRHAFGHWPFIVAIGKMILRRSTGQVLQKLDGVFSVF